jgi:hypothetical protein
MAAQSPEERKRYHVSKAFKSLNTKAHRTAIDEEEFSWIENAQPIGSGNIRIIPGPLPSQSNLSANVVFVGNVTYMNSVEIKGKTYIATFQDTGGSQFYDVDNGNVVTVAANSTFSTTGVTCTQFNKEYAIIGDPNKGLFVWDANVTVQLGAGGAIGMLNVGANYTSIPAVTVSAPDQAGGIQAAATATLTGNVVSSVVWTQPGTGYTQPPVITISGGGGTNAQAISSLLSFRTGQIYYQVLNGGENYTYANVTVTGGGGDNTANARAIISNGSIINIIPQSLGNNYSNQANLVITVTGDGSNAQIKAFVESNTVTDVASYAGRVWVSQGREMIYSAATNFNDFVGLSSGGFYVTDSTLHGNILGMCVANNFLYFFGDDSVNVISDVLVNSTGTTNLTNTNVSASIGTNLSASVFPYYRYIMLQNSYGVYGLIGSTMVKLSDALDGIYPFIDFTKPVTGGQVIINNILCASFNFYCNTGTFGGSRWIQAVFFDKKWFLTSQGSINYVTGSPIAGTLGLYGVSGKQLYRLYNDSTDNAVSSIVQTALWPLGDPIRDKQTLKFGVEAIIPSGGGLINLTVDNPLNSTSAYTLANYLTWLNNFGTTIGWLNNSNATVQWVGGLGGYQLYRSDAQQPSGGSSGQKYIGLTMTSNTANLVYNTFELEYEYRARF